MHSRCQKKSWPGLSVLLTSDLSPTPNPTSFLAPKATRKTKVQAGAICRQLQKPKEEEDEVGQDGFPVMGSVGKIPVIWEKNGV